MMETPDETLSRLRRLARLVRKYNGNPASTADDMVEAFYDLDRHLSRGGVLPVEWVARTKDD